MINAINILNNIPHKELLYIYTVCVIGNSWIHIQKIMYLKKHPHLSMEDIYFDNFVLEIIHKLMTLPISFLPFIYIYLILFK